MCAGAALLWLRLNIRGREMSELSEPLTPPECDLRGMEWMPLHGHKLYGSDFDAIANDAEYRAAQRLWWAAWQQQVPAASLPDDDRVLAHAAGYGRDHKGWMRIKDAALHAFVKCSDGRLYHRFLAPEAIVAWERRVKERDRKATYRAKRDGTDGGGNKVVPSHVPRDNQGTGCAPDAEVRVPSHVDNTTQDRTGQLRKKERTEATLPATADAAPSSPRDARAEIWREGLHILRSLTGKPENVSRGFLGRMLKILADDCDAGMAVLLEAESLRPVGPEAWVIKACEARGKRAETGISARHEKMLRAGGLWPEDGITIDGTANFGRALLQ
jgi:hypothetical protein